MIDLAGFSYCNSAATNKKYLIWLDILGFDGLAKGIAEETGVSARKVRDDFINTITSRIDIAKNKKEIVGVNYGERDDWIIVTDSSDATFRVISEILDHNTQYANHERIPLEIAIGTGEYDKWACLDDKKLVTEESTLVFLKTNIVSYYHGYLKRHAGKLQTSTFIVLTESAYRELNPLDKAMCQRVRRKAETDHGKQKTVIFFAIDVDAVKQRGKMFEFLEKIGRPSSRLYDRIDSLYVPPNGYRAISKALKINKIVFITGTAEYGKTYTAIRLLWEYFCRGYDPLWISGEEPQERIDVRKRLEEIEREISSHQIIYFEDPFGKIRYENRDSLRREIGTIIEYICKAKDAYVIVTSREEVFKQFEKERLSLIEVKRFEKKLNLKKPSYGYTKRATILLKWAAYKDCRWMKHSELKTFVLEEMRNFSILPTPLSIKDFVYSTVDTEERTSLVEKIREKSKEATKSFSEEIENMLPDKILFLSFPFIARFSLDFVRNWHNKLIRILNLERPSDFEQVLNWFKDDKIVITKGMITFSHPSYQEAFGHLLTKNEHTPSLFREIFIGVLFELASDDDAANEIAWALKDIVDVLDEDVRRTLFTKLAEKKDTARALASVISTRFESIPRDVRSKLLLSLANEEKAAKDIAWAVANNFERIPQSTRKLLLCRLVKKSPAIEAIASAVLCHFSEIPDSIRKIVLGLAEKDRTANSIALAVSSSFGKIPLEIRDRLLLKLAKKQLAAKTVASTVFNNFAKLPLKLCCDILVVLADKEDAIWIVASTLAKYSRRLPSEIQGILLKLSNEDDATIGVAWALEDYFENLRPKLREGLLANLADKAPSNVTEILLHHYHEIPVHVRDKVLRRIEERDTGITAFVLLVAQTLRTAQSKIVVSVGLKDRLQHEVDRWVGSPLLPYKEDAVLLISTLGPQLDKGFVCETLDRLDNAENDRIRKKVRELLNLMSCEEYFKTSAHETRGLTEYGYHFSRLFARRRYLMRHYT